MHNLNTANKKISTIKSIDLDSMHMFLFTQVGSALMVLWRKEYVQKVPLYVHEIHSRVISDIMFMLPWMQIGPALSGIATKGVKIEKAP